MATVTARARREPVVITCSGCGAHWTALGAAHCAACHVLFATVALFDAHRDAAGAHGRCRPPHALATALSRHRSIPLRRSA